MKCHHLCLLASRSFDQKMGGPTTKRQATVPHTAATRGWRRMRRMPTAARPTAKGGVKSTGIRPVSPEYSVYGVDAAMLGKKRLWTALMKVMELDTRWIMVSSLLS